MIRWKWLMLVWGGFGMALSAGADNGVQITCTQKVLTEAPPQIQVGISIALDPAEPVSPTFSNTLKYPARMEDRAITFAQVQGEGTLSFQGKGDTWVKYSPQTHELVIVVRGRILFYEDVGQRRFEFERPQDVFDSLYRAQVRGQRGIAHAEPFEHFSRDRHFRQHGREFGAPDETSYEAEALEFAERDCGDCLAIDFTEHGQPRTFKADFSTREVVITGRGQRIVTYYKNEGALNPYRKFFSNLLKRAVN